MKHRNLQLLAAVLVYFLLFGNTKASSQTWSNVGTGIYGSFKCFAVYNGFLYAGGIDSLNGKKTSVAKWDGTNWTATDTGQLGHVISMIVYKGKLYAGTEFTDAGLTFGNILCWNDTNWTVSGKPNGKVTCFAIYDSVLYAGGFFTMVDTMRARHIAKWCDTLNKWVMVNRSGIEGKVLSLMPYHRKLFAGGQFDYVTSYNGKQWEDVRVNGNGYVNGWVQSFAVWNEDLYAAGQFDFVAKWDGSAWSSMGPFNDVVGTIAVYHNELYAGGDFTGVPQYDHAYHIAKYSGVNWDCVGGVIYWGGDCKAYTGTIWALCVYKDELYMGGQFMIAGGKIIQNIARWNKPIPK